MGYLDLAKKVYSINGITIKDILVNNAKSNFDIHFKDSPFYTTISIENYDGSPLSDISAVILEHTNPINEGKEDRKLYVSNDITIHRGSIITWDSEKWMIMSEVSNSDDVGIYYKVKILKCNNVLTFKNKTGVTITTPIIMSDFSTSTDGLGATDKILLQNDLRYAFVPYNSDTKELILQQRFIFNHNSVFKISDIDDLTYICNQNDSINGGVLKVTFARCEFVDGDDRVNNLAYNSDLVITPTPTGNIVIGGSNTIEIGSQNTYTVNYDNGDVLAESYTFAVDSNKVSIISSTSQSVILKGTIAGQVKLTATNSVDDTKVYNKIINIISGF